MKNRKLVRLNVSMESDQALARMRMRVNDGFDGGNISKSELVSWLLIHSEDLLDKYIKSIRRSHFDGANYIEHILQKRKEANKNGVPCPEFDELMERLSINKSVPKKSFGSDKAENND